MTSQRILKTRREEHLSDQIISGHLIILRVHGSPADQRLGKKGRERAQTTQPDSQLVVEVLVDLFGFAVLAEHTAEDAHAALPDQLERKARVGGTPALTGTGVPSFPALTRDFYIFRWVQEKKNRKKRRRDGESQ